MKKLLIVLLIFLTACGANGAPRVSLATEVCMPTPTPVCVPITAPVSPTVTPAPTFTPTSTAIGPQFPAGFDAYDGTVDPPRGLYNVNALSGPDLWNYTYPKQPNAWFPATYFPGYNTSTKGFNQNFAYCPLSIVGPLMQELNTPQAENYGTNSSNGVAFGDHGIRTVIFPSTVSQPNIVHIKGVAFLKSVGGTAQWWGTVETLTCSQNALAAYIKDPKSIPNYFLEWQSDMTYNGALLTGVDLMGFPFVTVLAAPANEVMYIPFRMLIPSTWQAMP